MGEGLGGLAHLRPPAAPSRTSAGILSDPEAPVDVPATVLAIVLAETAIGGLFLLWLAPTFGALRHGYEVLLGSTLALMAWGAWASLRSPLANVIETGSAEVGSSAEWAARLLLGVAIAATVSSVLPLAKLPKLGRVAGLVAIVLGVGAFLAIAGLRAARGEAGGVAQGFAELAFGAFFMGAIWDGMILGHWYLVERRLSNRYMVWMAWVNVAAVLTGFGAVLLSARNPVPCAGLVGSELELCAISFSPILAIGGVTIMMGIGVVALIGLISGFNVKLANEGGRSIQAATGMFYLAVILAPAAEFAAKVRFF